MYAASSSPRAASTRWRRASISLPNSSSCSGVRRGSFGSLARTVDFFAPLTRRTGMSVIVMVFSLGCGAQVGGGSEVDGAVADRSGHADPDLLVRQRRLLAGDHVAYGAVGLGLHAREADAHPATELGPET